MTLTFILNFVNGESKELLLTSNKSGTHFCLYSIQYLTQKPIKNILGEGFHLFHTGLEISDSKSPIYHSHIPESVRNYLQEEDKLIFLTRSPIELLLRTFGYEQSKALLEIIAYDLPYDPSTTLVNPSRPGNIMPIRNGLLYVYQLLNDYQSYHDYALGEKVIVYYEDIITKPECVMKNILDFIHEDDSKLTSYIDDIEQIRKNAYNAYVAQWDRDPSYITNSDGKNPFFYQEKQSAEEIEEMKKLLRLVFPQECFRYLERFERQL